MRFVSSPRGASKPEWIDAITQSSPASSSSSMFTVPSRRMSTSTPRSTWIPFTVQRGDLLGLALERTAARGGRAWSQIAM